MSYTYYVIVSDDIDSEAGDWRNITGYLYYTNNHSDFFSDCEIDAFKYNYESDTLLALNRIKKSHLEKGINLHNDAYPIHPHIQRTLETQDQRHVP